MCCTLIKFLDKKLNIKNFPYFFFVFLGGMEKIQKHSINLAEKAVQFLIELRHRYGMPVAKIYGKNWECYKDKRYKIQGPIVTFNLLRANGSFVGFVEVVYQFFSL